MLIKFTDYNNAGSLIENQYAQEWGVLQTTLESMPLHIKESDQAGKIGNFIFNPVGTNNHIKVSLQMENWLANISIPSEYNFLGKDVDFVKNGIITEVQFSNYPFLLNNVLRTELFYKARTLFVGNSVDCLIIITKAHMFPASNSTLYYEQAQNQLNALARNNVFTVPIRLVGLFEEPNSLVNSLFTKYTESRYSRGVVSETNLQVHIFMPKGINSICCIKNL